MANPSYETHIPVPPNPSPYPEQKSREEPDSLNFHVEPAPSLGYGTASSMPPPPPPQYQMYQGPLSAKAHQDLFVESQENIFISHAQTPTVPDYLRYSICSMFCCFLPFGIVAVIYSIKTQESNRNGNHTAALENSRLARIFISCAVGLGLLLWILYITLIALHK